MLFLGFTIIQSCSSLQIEGGTYKPMQDDFDKIRLDHILIINDLVNEYEEKTGYFPFANHSKKPIVVAIASEEQIKYDKGRAPRFLDLNTRAIEGKIPEKPQSIEQPTLQDLIQEFEKVLQRPVTLPIDPQRVPVNK